MTPAPGAFFALALILATATGALLYASWLAGRAAFRGGSSPVARRAGTAVAVTGLLLAAASGVFLTQVISRM